MPPGRARARQSTGGAWSCLHGAQISGSCPDCGALPERVQCRGVSGRPRQWRPDHLREQDREPPPVLRTDPGVAQVLRLQQAAGNRAVGRVLARRAVRQTGLRGEQAINRFVHKAQSFLGRNGDGEINQFALYLGAAINEELAAIGVPPVRVVMFNQTPNAAEFDATDWTIVLNPDMFSPRRHATLMGDL